MYHKTGWRGTIGTIVLHWHTCNLSKSFSGISGLCQGFVQSYVWCVVYYNGFKAIIGPLFLLVSCCVYNFERISTQTDWNWNMFTMYDLLQWLIFRCTYHRCMCVNDNLHISSLKCIMSILSNQLCFVNTEVAVRIFQRIMIQRIDDCFVFLYHWYY